jgi:hypothetical protein
MLRGKRAFSKAIPGPLADVLSQLVVRSLLVGQASHHGQLGDQQNSLVLKMIPINLAINTSFIFKLQKFGNTVLICCALCLKR